MRLRTTKVFVDNRYAVMGTSGSSILFEIPGVSSSARMPAAS
jgi:hypothetical protein